jgi:hypothetical protein
MNALFGGSSKNPFAPSSPISPTHSLPHPFAPTSPTSPTHSQPFSLPSSPRDQPHRPSLDVTLPQPQFLFPHHQPQQNGMHSPPSSPSQPRPNPFTPQQNGIPYSSPQSPTQPQPQPQPHSTRTDGPHAHLASLLANKDDGQDTFGNVGPLRYGQTDVGRLVAQKTGLGSGVSRNPFTRETTDERPFFDL